MTPEPATGPPPATVEYQAALLRQALRQARWNLALVLLMLLAFVGAVAAAALYVRNQLPGKGQQLAGTVKDRLVNDIGPMITSDAGEFLARTADPVAQAVSDRLRARLPAYVRAASKQGTELSNHLADTLRDAVHARYDRMIQGYRSILEKEFPDAPKDQLDKMTARIEAALDKLIHRYYVEAFRARTDRTVKLWKAIEPEPAGKPGEKPLADQLSDAVEDWVMLKALEGVVGKSAADQILAPAVNPKPTPGKEGR